MTEYDKRPEFAELLAIFAMSEAEQAAYFPRSGAAGWIHFGDYDTPTETARFTACCALQSRARAAGGYTTGESLHLAHEVNALTRLLDGPTTKLRPFSQSFT